MTCTPFFIGFLLYVGLKLLDTLFMTAGSRLIPFFHFHIKTMQAAFLQFNSVNYHLHASQRFSLQDSTITYDINFNKEDLYATFQFLDYSWTTYSTVHRPKFNPKSMLRELTQTLRESWLFCRMSSFFLFNFLNHLFYSDHQVEAECLRSV